MAFLRRAGNILRQTARKQIYLDISSSRPSLFQTLRCMSSSKLFVGGLSYGTDEQNLMEAFARYGEVTEARVIMDRETGRSRGFGFVTYTSTEEASSAMQALDGADLQGRRVRVNFATERPTPQYGGGGGRGYGGGGYSGGGYGGGDGRGYGGGSYNAIPDGRNFAGYDSVPGGGNFGPTENYTESGYNTSPGPESDDRASGNFGSNPSYGFGRPGLGGDSGMRVGDVSGGLNWNEGDMDGEKNERQQ